MEARITTAWQAQIAAPKGRTADWFKELAKDILKNKEGASKVALARSYAFLCREKLDVTIEESRKPHAVTLCAQIIEALSLPGTKAKHVIEAPIESPASIWTPGCFQSATMSQKNMSPLHYPLC